MIVIVMRKKKNVKLRDSKELLRIYRRKI
jgi:hypothetical protein